MDSAARIVSGGDRLQSMPRVHIFFPCSGNGNGQSWNNRGSNGNYWSRSLNSQTNGRNLNFNSGGVNPQNNNNRFNGFTRRAVQHSSTKCDGATATADKQASSKATGQQHDESRLPSFFFIKV